MSSDTNLHKNNAACKSDDQTKGERTVTSKSPTTTKKSVEILITWIVYWVILTVYLRGVHSFAVTTGCTALSDRSSSLRMFCMFYPLSVVVQWHMEQFWGLVGVDIRVVNTRTPPSDFTLCIVWVSCWKAPQHVLQHLFQLLLHSGLLICN